MTRGQAGATALLLAACGGGGATGMPATQQFAREVRATPSAIVAATVALFSDYQIPIETADEQSGIVRSAPLAITGNWGPVPPAERLNCPTTSPDSARGTVRFEVTAKPVREGSVVALDARRVGETNCVIRSSFITDLLDRIGQTAGSR